MKNFIVFCGIDGSGKTSALRSLSNDLYLGGENCIYTREPRKGIRKCLLDSINTPYATHCLFMADRDNHQSALSLWLKSFTVLCDRYLLSNMAYQGGDLGISWILDENIKRNFITPDLTFYFDCDPEVSYNRTEKDSINTSLENLITVRDRYEEALKMYPYPVIRIDANQEKLEVFEEVYTKYKEWKQNVP